jgi:hypothetical protein
MRRAHWLIIGSAACGALALAACSSNSNGGIAGFTGGNGGVTGAGTGGFNVGGGDNGGSGGGIIVPDSGNTGGGGTGPNCSSGPDEDQDQDGFSVNQGDCNDCDPNVNPGAIDVMHTGDPDGGPDGWGDEDCSGTPGDSAQQACDGSLVLDDTDPYHAANAIELCQTATDADNKWGVLSAAWVRADGSPYAAPGLQVGIQSAFGANVHPQGGHNMLAISSGYSRTEGQPGACGSFSCSNGQPDVSPPPGFPEDSGSCLGGTDIHDDVALEVKLRAPTNATGYSFNFRFYSFEYPEWVCTTFNDQFITLVNPAPAGAIDGNICFDANNKPVSVNVAFFQVCDGCPAGNQDMVGTGFNVWNDAGATVWLSTTAPVTGGETVTLRFTIWDTGDSAWDSTALIDNFQWIANGGTVSVGTTPVPVPK